MTQTRQTGPATHRRTDLAARRRCLATAATLVGVVALGGCITRGVGSLPPDLAGQTTGVFEARPTRKVDILFVVDDSGSMAEEQENLGRNFQSFVRRLQDEQGSELDARIAVVSTDVGLPGAGLPEGPCNDPRRNREEGYAGQLMTQVHLDPLDWEASESGRGLCLDDPANPYFDAQRCEQLKQNREWLAANCEDVEASMAGKGWLESNPAAPLAPEELARRFRCIGSLGISGCFVEQPLEAARRALEAHKDTFLRKDAHLAVIFITDEADCSVADVAKLSDPRLPQEVGLDKRCYRYAQACQDETRMEITGPDGKPQTVTGYGSCQDQPGWLIPVDSYRQFFADLKGPGSLDRVIVAAITGDADYSSTLPQGSGGGSGIRFAWNDTTGDYVPSCASRNGKAAPSRRLQDLVNAFPDPRSGKTSLVSICNDDFTGALEQLGERISGQVSTICVDLPVDATLSGTDPNFVCVLDEYSSDNQLLRGVIRADQGWAIQAGSPACPAPADLDPALARVEITIEPSLRESFAPGSLLLVACAR